VILTTAGLLASYWCSHQSVSECTACSSVRRIAPPQIGVIVAVPRGWVFASQRTQGLDRNLSFTPAKFQVEPSTQHHALARAVSARYWRPQHLRENLEWMCVLKQLPLFAAIWVPFLQRGSY